MIRWLMWAGIALVTAYLLLGVAVVLHHVETPSPDLAALLYLQALQKRDPAAMYRHAEGLSAHLSGVLAGSGLSAEERRRLEEQDVERFRQKLGRGSRDPESLGPERALITPSSIILPVVPDEYKAEVAQGEELELIAYQDVPGQIHHAYFQVSFPARAGAPAVSVLANADADPELKIRSVVVRVEVRRRPDVRGLSGVLFDARWLEHLAPAFPTGLFDPADPADRWASRLSLAVDRKSLQTF